MDDMEGSHPDFAGNGCVEAQPADLQLVQWPVVDRRYLRPG